MLRLRSGRGGVRGARACFKLSEDWCGHIELSGHGNRVADSARGAEALDGPTSAPQDSLHSHIHDTGNRADAV